MATRISIVLFTFMALSFTSHAQQSSSLTDVQQQGMLAFRQHCQVCHVKPMIGDSKYGPRLSKEFVIGREAFARKQILEGSDRMPGFKYGLKPAQVDAIIEYLKTVERPVETKGKKTTDESTDQDN